MYWKLMNKSDWQKILKDFADQKKLIDEVTQSIYQIETGDLNVRLSEQILDTKLGTSLQLMTKYLLQIREEEESRAWFNKGLSFFLELIRNKDDQAFDILMDRCLSELVKYVGANQGAVFILKDESQDAYIEMIACYAYDRKKFLNKKQYFGEGLAGQSIIEKDSIYLKSIPTDYVHITSGLGEATPRNVFITPLMINETVVGVIELASFNDFKPKHLDFIKKIAENLASLIRSGNEKKRLEEVLTISQEQTENLRAQEEEMRQNLEEMTAMQEQLARNETELKRRLTELEEALLREKGSEIQKIRDEEKGLLESKLEAQKKSYELIINKLKEKLQKVTINN
jgi:GAF domain-containing protein